MDLASITTHESQSLPGVTFTLRVVSAGRRLRYRQQCAAEIGELARLQREAEFLRLDQAGPLAELAAIEAEEKPSGEQLHRYATIANTPEILALQANLRASVALAESMSHNKVDVFLDSVHGLKIDGNDWPNFDVVSEAPAAFTREIIAAIDAQFALSESDAKN